jgi:NADH dehydrogenase
MAHWLILGGSGFVGRALAERLNRPEHDANPRLLVPTCRALHAVPLGHLPRVDVAQADVHDDAELRSLVAGAQVVVNLIGTLHGDEAAFEQVHVDLPRRLAAACRTQGTRILHVSALGASPDAPSMYLRSKARGEAALRDSGVACTIFRPSVIFGAGDQLLNLFARLQRWLPVLPLAAADARFQPVWVGDVAEAIARCIERPETVGQAYECAGPEEMTLAELVQAAGRHAGHPRPLLKLPPALGEMQAALMRLWPGRPLLTHDNLASMRVPSVATPGLPGLGALGIRPTPLAAIAHAVLGHEQGTERLNLARARHRG